ncbi:transposase, partial [Mesorhizobium sp. Cs1299R1N3]|uniref:transposase n=1 Tax=Mesorhizobium sp. Cs1299R1N3 TaxID=3015173 RepID=UPI003FA55E13
MPSRPHRSRPSTSAWNLAEAKADLAAWLAKWSGRYPRLTTWAEETIESTMTFFRLPR